jgi:FkbM family methyltransferase
LFRAIVSVGPTRRARLRIAGLIVWLRAKQVARRRGGRLYRVDFTLHERRESMVVGEFTDLCGLAELLGDVYDVPRAPPPSVILDLGSSIGVSVKQFRARFPNAEIHAVEPDPVALAALRANTAGDPRVFVHPFALGRRCGRQRFYQSRLGWASSLFGDRDEAGGRWIEVDVVTLSDLLDRLGLARVGLIKMDIEGAEWGVFANTSLAAVADVIVGELHDGHEQIPAALSPGLDGMTLRTGGPGHEEIFVAVTGSVSGTSTYASDGP